MNKPLLLLYLVMMGLAITNVCTLSALEKLNERVLILEKV